MIGVDRASNPWPSPSTIRGCAIADRGNSLAGSRAGDRPVGLAHVRVADIAERAGIGPGHVTCYFPSKDDLLMQAIGRSERQFHDTVDKEISRIADLWERLGKPFELAAADGPGDAFLALWFEVWAKAGSDPEVAEEGANWRRGGRRAFGTSSGTAPTRVPFASRMSTSLCGSSRRSWTDSPSS